MGPSKKNQCQATISNNPYSSSSGGNNTKVGAMVSLMQVYKLMDIIPCITDRCSFSHSD